MKTNQNANSWYSETINLKPDLMWERKMAERLRGAEHWFFRNVVLVQSTHGQFPGQRPLPYNLYVFVRNLLSTLPSPHRSEEKVR